MEMNSDLSQSYDDKLTAIPPIQRTSLLSNKLASILSASYADSEIRDALNQLDATDIQNTPETRRRIRLDVQKEVIECNAGVIDEFGAIAEVRPPTCRLSLSAEYCSATATDWRYDRSPEYML